MEKAKPKRMRMKKPKSKMRWVFLLFWFAVAGLSFVLVVRLAGQYNELRANYWHVRAQVDAEEARNHELRLRMEFDDGDAYIERLARERLGMVRPNEIVFRNIAAE